MRYSTLGSANTREAMSYSRGDVVWLRIDNLEGGVGRLHPAIVVSSDSFNDTHAWGVVIRGTSRVPQQIEDDQFLVAATPENGLDRDTLFLPIIQSTVWSRITKCVGKLPPHQLRQVMERVSAILAP